MKPSTYLCVCGIFQHRKGNIEPLPKSHYFGFRRNPLESTEWSSESRSMFSCLPVNLPVQFKLHNFQAHLLCLMEFHQFVNLKLSKAQGELAFSIDIHPWYGIVLLLVSGVTQNTSIQNEERKHGLLFYMVWCGMSVGILL